MLSASLSVSCNLWSEDDGRERGTNREAFQTGSTVSQTDVTPLCDMWQWCYTCHILQKSPGLQKVLGGSPILDSATSCDSEEVSPPTGKATDFQSWCEPCGLRGVFTLLSVPWKGSPTQFLPENYTKVIHILLYRRSYVLNKLNTHRSESLHFGLIFVIKTLDTIWGTFSTLSNKYFMKRSSSFVSRDVLFYSGLLMSANFLAQPLPHGSTHGSLLLIPPSSWDKLLSSHLWAPNTSQSVRKADCRLWECLFLEMLN